MSRPHTKAPAGVLFALALALMIAAPPARGETSSQNPAASPGTSEAPKSGPAAAQSPSPQVQQQANIERYPTRDETFYVLSCMKLNGDDANAMTRCSCAVNAVEKRLSYDQYTDAQMVIALRQAGGRTAGIYRDTPAMKGIVNDFIRAQSAANTQCFGAAPGAPKEARK